MIKKVLFGAILVAHLTVNAGETPRFERILVPRAELNRPVGRKHIYVQVFTVGDDNQRSMSIMLCTNSPIPTDLALRQIAARTQIVPDRCKWYFRSGEKVGHSFFTVGFTANRDGLFYTDFRFSSEELRTSKIELYIKDLDNDGIREDLTIILPMADYDWSPTAALRAQGKMGSDK